MQSLTLGIEDEGPLSEYCKSAITWFLVISSKPYPLGVFLPRPIQIIKSKKEPYTCCDALYLYLRVGSTAFPRCLTREEVC